MRTRRLGRSTVEVTELGFGAAPVGNLYREVSEAEARGAVDAAWDCGVRYFDTAPHYGLGLSERRLGAALAGRPRAEYVLSTKVGRLLEPWPGGGMDPAGFAVPASHRRVWDFSVDGVRRSLASSLDRLGLDRVDVVLLHDPDGHWEQAVSEAYPALARLRGEGVVGAIGVGMNQCEMPARFVRHTDIDVVMLAGRYTLLEQPAADDLLPLCAERGVSVLAAGVFNSGLLARPDVPEHATYDYAPAPPALLERARRIAAVCRRHGVTLPRAAAWFPLGHPAVASVVLGTHNAAQVTENAGLLAEPVPAELWDELRAEGLLRGDVPVPTGVSS
ncbi:aldo/keto reductase [Gandjariella thermophila]|uniref:Oxidoreductase n=1 Tax=Gandjariella thermophila TaxID=1931992 RepID=A0A4D4J6T7_9PSEU|nr:aldo/keto reductase [Gandjariella thermophila]GDY30259.1 oxidoreductase [Gandjariella thermophila]